MKHLFRYFSAIFFFSACFPSVKTAGEFTAQEFNDMADQMSKGPVRDISVADLTQKTAPNTVLLDARERREYEVSHLANARWVGFDDFNLERVTDLPKDAPIVVYCSVGYRSERIGEKLEKAGFEYVENLKGGIFDWANQGLPVVDGQGQKVQTIHGFNEKWGKWVKRGKVVFE
ncbi:MAG: rhodanese-like domain-containing protein [Bacteroidetes bacterium]|nr:rhodanese-like domain-containing protein [Bacteroidota bacterium]